MNFTKKPTERGHIIIVVPHLNIKGGGLATLAQLSVVIRQLGYTTYFAMWDSKMSFVLRQQNKKNKRRGYYFLPSPLLNTIPVPTECYWIREEAIQRATIKDTLYQKVRKKIRRIFEDIWFKSQGAAALFCDAEFVLFAASLGKKEIDAWRRHTPAPLVFNHAGSLDAIAQVSLTRSYAGQIPGLSDEERYVNFFSELDGVLFQADTQEREFNELFERSNKRPPATAVAAPPCSELQVLVSSPVAKSEKALQRGRERNVLCIGSLQRRKNQLDAIIVIEELLKRNWKVKLRLVGSIGESEYEERIRRYITCNGLRNTVELVGHVDNPLPMIRSCDLILHTATSEGQSRVLREAMYSKTLVATYRVSGTDSLFNFRDDCISAPFGDTKLMADNIMKIWSDCRQEEELIENAFFQYLRLNSESAYRHNINDFIGLMRQVSSSKRTEPSVSAR